MTFKKKIQLILFLFIIIVIIGLFLANKYAKRYGYNNGFDVVKTYIHNKSLAGNVEVKQLKIEITNRDLDFIKAKREIALDRGIQINKGDNYVDCTVDFDSDTSEGKIRLKGHMTDHLQGNKWSYRVKTKEPVQGMYRFSIQHPGTRNYVYEWIYHQLLKNEGIIYLNYDFVEVHVNDRNLGIYALEEHFGQHVLERNKRPGGAILRWNPELYWDWRIDELQGVYIDEEYSSFSTSFAEFYDRKTIKNDPVLLDNYKKGAYLLEMFRRGEMTTSEVFDIERMARFHVIIDLVGGYHSLDWSDVKFYYNTETGKIEPVGYESFSVRKTERIAGQRVRLNYDKTTFNYHDQLFSDPQFFESYIRNMERIVSEDYFHNFINGIQSELDKKMGIIAKEWPYRKVSFEKYFENIKLIRNNINLPKPFHAFISQGQGEKITISVAPVSDFPIQIVGIKRKDKVESFSTPFNVPSKARETYTKYFNLSIENPFSKETNLFLIAKIPGSSATYEVEMSEFPAYKDIIESDSLSNNTILTDSSIILAKGKHWFFKNNNTVLSKVITVPEDITLFLYPSQILTIKEKGQLIVNGRLSAQAYNDEAPVLIESRVESGIVLKEGIFSAKHTHFVGKSLISAYNSQVKLNQCLLYDMSALFKLCIKSNIVIANCDVGTLKSLGEINESVVNIDNSTFTNGNVLGYSNGSYWHMKNSEIRNYQKALSLDYGSTAKIYYSNLSGFDTIANLEHGSKFYTFVSDIINAKVGFQWPKNSLLQTPSDINIYRTKTANIQKMTVEG